MRAAAEAAAQEFVGVRTRERSRLFLQRRLALMGQVGFGFALTFYVLFNVANSLEPGFGPAHWFGLWSNRVHLLLVLLFLALWRLCRAPRDWTQARLELLDAGATWLACLLCAISAWGAIHPGNRKYGMLLEIVSILLCRAAIVPSTGLRTALIGLLVMPGAVHAAYVFDSGLRALVAQRCASAPGCHDLLSVRSLALFTSEAALFVLLGASVATLTSQIIYGLRVEVREARRLGQYVLLEKVGQGGMGVVYRARHTLLRRATAVKLLPPGESGDDSLRRFEQEVQITARLTHPNTVAVYDYGRTPDGVFYYAMEYLDGPNLEQLVRVAGPLPAARVVHLLRQVCASLHEAHALGLVHRDVKPANVMLCQRWGEWDVVKVVDFGLVRELRPEASPEAATHSQVAAVGVAGTPHYMSPESIRAPATVGPASDIYAVGATAYFLLTGARVFEGETILDVLSQQLASVPQAPSQRLGRSLPVELEELVLACLDKRVEGRPPSAAELGVRLFACADVGLWTQADARAAWERDAPRLARTAPQDAPQALTVDLGRRAVDDDAPTAVQG